MEQSEVDSLYEKKEPEELKLPWAFSKVSC